MERDGRVRINELIQEFGKVPPQALEIEEAVIASMIIEGSSYSRVTWIKPEHFYKETHRIIWEHVEKFAGKSFDLLTLAESLKRSDQLDLIGGPYFLTQLSNSVGTTFHLEEHAEIVLEKFKSRECIRLSHQIQEAGFNGDLETVGKLSSGLFEILSSQRGKEIKTIKDVSRKVLDNIIRVTTGSNEVSGLPTGFAVIDRMIYGLNDPDLIVIAGRPGMGKTALALAIALYVAKGGHDVLFDTMEMSAEQLFMRALSHDAEIPLGSFKMSNGLGDGQLDSLVKVTELLNELPIHFDDTPAQDILAIKAKARRMKALHNIKLLVVDYIQLGKSKTGGSREQEISNISGGLKAIAMELGIPVIALSQMNRSVETRGGAKEPQLADLRESGSIEQDADIVLFPYRPEYYDIKEIDFHGKILNSEGMVIVKVAKHRSGATGDVLMKFDGKFIKFRNIEEDSYSSPGDKAIDAVQGDMFSDIEDDDLVF